jgi:hypothetical protein
MRGQALRLRLCAGLSGLLALVCLWGFADSRQEIPTQALQKAEGTVAWIEPIYGRGKVRELRFALFDQPRVYSHSPGLPGHQQVLEQLRRGTRVQLEYGPSGDHDLWAFQMNGEVLMTPQQRLQGLRNAGWMFLGFALCLALLAAWLWRRAAQALRV